MSVFLLSEMLEVLFWAIEVMSDKAQPLRLQINWQKNNINTSVHPELTADVAAGSHVDIVDFHLSSQPGPVYMVAASLLSIADRL